MQHHHHQEFEGIEREVPAVKVIQVILDNYAAHKKDRDQAWLAAHLR